MDGPLVGLVGEGVPNFPFHGGLNEAVVGIIRRRADKVHGRPVGHHSPAHGDMGGLRVQLHRHLEHILTLPPVDGQHLVALDPAHRLPEVVVEAVDGVLRLLVRCPGRQHGPAQVQLPQLLADAGVVGDALGNDVAGPLEGFRRRLHPLLGVDEVPGGLLYIDRRTEGESQIGQRFQALFPGDGGPGAPLLLVGAIQVLHLGQGGGGVDGGGQLFRQLALVLNGTLYLGFSGVQIAQILQPVGQRPQKLVVHGAVELLPVSGDKRNSGPLVNEAYYILHMLLGAAQLPGQGPDHQVHMSFSLQIKSKVRTVYPNRAEKSRGM